MTTAWYTNRNAEPVVDERATRETGRHREPSTSPRPASREGSTSGRDAAIRRAVVLLLGAGAVIGAIQPLGPLAYYWVPVFLGGTFALAAAASGRGSPLMGAGLTVFGFGLAKAITANFAFEGDFSMAIGLIGLGGVLAYGLQRFGWPSSALSIGAAAAFIGLGQFIHGTFGSWITPYGCMLAGLWGVAELVNAVRGRRAGSVDREAYPVAA